MTTDLTPIELKIAKLLVNGSLARQLIAAGEPADTVARLDRLLRANVEFYDAVLDRMRDGATNQATSSAGTHLLIEKGNAQPGPVLTAKIPAATPPAPRTPLPTPQIPGSLEVALRHAAHPVRACATRVQTMRGRLAEEEQKLTDLLRQHDAEERARRQREAAQQQARQKVEAAEKALADAKAALAATGVETKKSKDGRRFTPAQAAAHERQRQAKKGKTPTSFLIGWHRQGKHDSARHEGCPLCTAEAA